MRIKTILLAVGLLFLAGCSEKATEPAPAAGDTPVATEMPSEVSDLLISNTPEEADLTPAEDETWPDWPSYDLTGNCDVYAVTFVWGQFPYVPQVSTAATDWSGQLSVNGVSVVHPRATIDFEPGEDSLIANDIPSMAEWASHTAADFDGISFLVFLDKDVTYIVAPWLTFSTGPIKLEFDFHELDRFSAFYLLEGGNALAVHARKIWPVRCPGGFIDGKWIKEDNTGRNGRIEGIWRNYKGEPEGTLVGEFRTNNDGSREITGWVSGYYLTYIIAEFKGTWWYDDPRMCPAPWCGTGHGWFRGHFKYATDAGGGGTLAAEIGYFDVPVDAEGLELPFRGVWYNFCPWDPAVTETNESNN